MNIEHLNRYITSDYVKAAQRLRGRSKRRKVVAYVESYDDIFFWRTLLSELETEQMYFEVMLPSRTTLQKGKKTALLHALAKGLGRDMIVCVDADYDYLLDGSTRSSQEVCGNPYVFHTYTYAIENYQCYAPSLHGVCVMATLNDDHSLLDFEAFMAEYSRIIHPLFVWSVWAYRYGHFKDFSMADFATAVTPGSIDIFHPEAALARLQHKVNVAIARLQQKYPEGPNSSPKLGEVPFGAEGCVKVDSSPKFGEESCPPARGGLSLATEGWESDRGVCYSSPKSGSPLGDLDNEYSRSEVSRSDGGVCSSFAGRLAELGLTPETTYLYMRGHDLVEKVVAPLLENVCNILRRRRQKEIKNLAVHSTQRLNELAGYQHCAASPTEMLRKHTDYRRCPLYKRIQSDIAAQCL